MNVDLNNAEGPKGPSSESGFSERLCLLEGRFKNRSEIAKSIGVAKSSFQRWVEGQSTPSFDAMAKLAKVANVSLDWLAFGVGQGAGSATATSAAQCKADEALMSEIYLKIHSLVQHHSYTLSPEQHIEFTCNVYNKVMSKPDDREELITDAMVLLVTMLKGLKPQEASPETVGDQRQA